MSARKLMIVDYGAGNVQSVFNALRFIGSRPFISSNPQDLAAAEGVVLPGIGAFGEAMRNLEVLGVIGPLEEAVLSRRKPFLGICLGMQILAEDSDENGLHRGLGWIPGHVRRLEPGGGLRVPHVGWNDITIVKEEPLFSGVDGDRTFYFDHSYTFVCDLDYVAARCHYGAEHIVAVQHGHVFGTQFHPEKSSRRGLELLRNFMALC